MPKLPRKDIVLLDWSETTDFMTFSKNPEGQSYLCAFLGKAREIMPEALFIIFTKAYIGEYQREIAPEVDECPEISGVLRVPDDKPVSFERAPNAKKPLHSCELADIYPGARKVMLDNSIRALCSKLAILHNAWFIKNLTNEEVQDLSIRVYGPDLLKDMKAAPEDPQKAQKITDLLKQMKEVLSSQGRTTHAHPSTKKQKESFQSTFLDILN